MMVDHVTKRSNQSPLCLFQRFIFIIFKYVFAGGYVPMSKMPLEAWGVESPRAGGKDH